MRTDGTVNELEMRATEALKALLGEVSVVKLREIKCQPNVRGRVAEILAHVDVLGHSHTLACEINTDARPSKVRASLKKLQDSAAHVAGQATPVLIAPYLSPEAQALCKENCAGFLDLEGNARISLGEVFIGKRSLPQPNMAGAH
jgi:hypothetical protein